MPLLETRGAASAQGFGFAQSSVPNYIEEVFSAWIYAGTGAAQTINNGIDLAGKGGLVWTKARTEITGGPYNHSLQDTVRGTKNLLSSNNTDSAVTYTEGISFNSGGFGITGGGAFAYNYSGDAYASWTFREQPKFFDIVTYTGNGGVSQAISHTLGSVPGCVIIKRTDSAASWFVWHRSLTNGDYLFLNATNAAASGSPVTWPLSPATSSTFTVGYEAGVNASGGTYVMYLFAHNAGGFGLSGTDNVISCGSFTTGGSGVFSETLGYEPQFILAKKTSGTSNWFMLDSTRGMLVDSTASWLRANFTAAENSNSPNSMAPNATGFTSGSSLFDSSSTYIYIAIRRGPMKVPTTGTSVFTPTAYTGNGAGNRLINAGFPPDIFIPRVLNGAYGYNTWVVSRIQGGGQTMAFNAQFQEQVYDTGSFTREQLGYVTRSSTNIANPAGDSMIGYSIRRAPSFYDTVCWTANGSAANINHNLTVRPQLILAKNRLNSSNWFVLVGGSGRFSINSTNAAGFNSGGADCLGSTTTTFSTSFLQDINSDQPIVNGQPYVAYLFASAPGVSRVSSYTGTGTTQVIDCGFTSGARFVMIKATSATGNWFVWDSARGISAGNDPYVLFNDSVPENTITDWVGTAATGFQLIVGGSNLANSNGVTYIFLAIA
jgi:hypothetical protein